MHLLVPSRGAYLKEAAAARLSSRRGKLSVELASRRKELGNSCARPPRSTESYYPFTFSTDAGDSDGPMQHKARASAAVVKGMRAETG